MTMPRDEAVRTIEHAATVLAGDGEPTIAANLIAACTTLAQHIAQQDATTARMREALETARDYVASDLHSEREAFAGYEHCSNIGSIAADLETIDAALTQENANGT